MNQEQKAKIKPAQPSGVKDYLPTEMIPRQALIDKARETFELFGFDPLETPGLELRNVLTTGKENSDMIIYSAHLWGRKVAEADDETNPKALRFDLTVPLARVIAANPNLPMPFKRYQVGKVWRGERPQKGRYREFTQFDADIVGSASPLADAEIIQLIDHTMRALEVGKFTIKINSRKVLNGLPQLVGYDPSFNTTILTIVDKIDKIGKSGVIAELQQSRDENPRSPELSDVQVEQLFQFLELDGSTNRERIISAIRIFQNVPQALEGLDELNAIADALEGYGVKEENWRIDYSVARGLGYYTGPVFETVLDDNLKIGSVFSGGRYDGLVSQFSDRMVPATGASIGIDRLVAALQELGKLSSRSTLADVMVITPNSAFTKEYNRFAAELRAYGIRTRLYLGKEKGVGNQLKASATQGVRFAIILDQAEYDKKIIVCKNLETREQYEITLNSIDFAHDVKMIIDPPISKETDPSHE